MPYLTIAIGNHRPLFQSWRIAFFIPAVAHLVMAMLILFFGQVYVQMYLLMQQEASMQMYMKSCYVGGSHFTCVRFLPLCLHHH